jgi:xylulokinase
LIASGARIESVTLTGGGARSTLWARLIAAAIGLPLSIQADAATGPAIGAARLARHGLGGPLIASPAGQASVVAVEPSLREQLLQKRVLFRKHPGLSR